MHLNYCCARLLRIYFSIAFSALQPFHDAFRRLPMNRSCSQQVLRKLGLVLTCLLLVSLVSISARAQGCVAAHAEQPLISGLSPNDQEQMAHQGDGFADKLHNLTV